MKERLIGAAVLVAFGVWIIPWVLDGRQDPADIQTETLELPAPSEMPPLKTETLRLDAEPSAPVVPVVVEATPVIEPAASSVAAAPVPAQAASSPPAPDPAPKAAPVVTPRPAPAADPPATAQAAGAETWMVQLGSFGEEENARRLAERVKVYGYEAEVSSFRSGGRTMHRVRIGPQPSRARAESVAAALGAHGFVAQVVPAE